LSVLARAIPSRLLHDCLQRLEVDIDVKDREAVSKYHGYALAAVDIIDAIPADPSSLEQLNDRSIRDDIVSNEASNSVAKSLCLIEKRLESLENKLGYSRITATKNSANQDLPTRERETYEKILIGLAVYALGYDPRQKRSPISREIAGELAAMDLDVSEDTVRNKLTAAAKHINLETLETRLRSPNSVSG
jgi:hypothetical protein